MDKTPRNDDLRDPSFGGGGAGGAGLSQVGLSVICGLLLYVARDSRRFCAHRQLPRVVINPSTLTLVEGGGGWR